MRWFLVARLDIDDVPPWLGNGVWHPDETTGFFLDHGLQIHTGAVRFAPAESKDGFVELTLEVHSSATLPHPGGLAQAADIDFGWDNLHLS